MKWTSRSACALVAVSALAWGLPTASAQTTKTTKTTTVSTASTTSVKTAPTRPVRGTSTIPVVPGNVVVTSPSS